MKKSGKALLLIGMATMAIGTVGIVNNVTTIQSKENVATIHAYNPTPANILENVFELDNNKYLPIVLDFEHTVTGITLETIREQFTKANLQIEKIESNSDRLVTTGTTIKIANSSDVYTVVVYGDVVGNGEIGASDATEIINYWLEGGEMSNRLKGQAFKLAANVYNDNEEIDSTDAMRIIDYWVGNEPNLVLNLPEPTPKPGDTEKPTISIEKPIVSVNFKDKYNDNDDDVTATDTVDGDLTDKVVREKIEFIPAGSSHAEIVTAVSTDRIGTYKIFYKVSDSSGNTETSTRTITVKGLSSIKIGHGNHELNLSTLNLYTEKPERTGTAPWRLPLPPLPSETP